MNKELFTTEYNIEKNYMTLYLSGEIDHHSAIALRGEIDKNITENMPATLIIELSSVDFMDSSGLGLIMGRYTTMQKIGGNVILRNPGEKVNKILKLAGMDRILKIEQRKEASK